MSTNRSKMDSMDSGLGSLVDADLAKESARLQALQIRQQLGTQSLSIANQAPQALLSLFRCRCSGVVESCALLMRAIVEQADLGAVGRHHFGAPQELQDPIRERGSTRAAGTPASRAERTSASLALRNRLACSGFR